MPHLNKSKFVKATHKKWYHSFCVCHFTLAVAYNINDMKRKRVAIFSLQEASIV